VDELIEDGVAQVAPPTPVECYNPQPDRIHFTYGLAARLNNCAIALGSRSANRLKYPVRPLLPLPSSPTNDVASTMASTRCVFILLRPINHRAWSGSVVIEGLPNRSISP
jgi:hypothetical protein